VGGLKEPDKYVAISGLHGYTHEHQSTLNEKQQWGVIAKSIDILTKFTGKKPKDQTALAWDTSKASVKLLEEFGIPRSRLKLGLNIL